MSIVIKNIVEPARKKFSDFLQTILNLKDKSIDTRKDAWGGSKVIGHAGKQEDPAKIIKQGIKEENENDK